MGLALLHQHSKEDKAFTVGFCFSVKRLNVGC